MGQINIKMKKLKAVTLIEIIISTTIMSLLLVGGFTMVLKKSKVLKADSNSKNMTFICYKGVTQDNGTSALKQLTIEGLNVPSKDDSVTAGNECVFKIPEGYAEYKVTLIGGGAGGSAASITYEWKSDTKTIVPYEKKEAKVFSTKDETLANDLVQKHVEEENKTNEFEEIFKNNLLILNLFFIFFPYTFSLYFFLHIYP